MTRSFMAMNIVAGFFPVVALASSGSSLYQQTPAPDDQLLQAASQDFPDAVQFSILAADDFGVPAGPGWHVNSLSTVFTTGGSAGEPLGLRWNVYDDNGPGGVPGTHLLDVVGGDFDLNTGAANIDLAAANADFNLGSGNYWFTAQLIGDIGTFGQEFVRGSLDGAGTSNFHWNNPGGGYGLPAGWVDAHGTINPATNSPWSDVSNLAFGIGGVVIPEPATIGLLILGSTAAFRRRRQ